MTAEAAERASWLTRPCPSWCAQGHEENEHPDDRACWGEDHAVALALEPRVHMSDGCLWPEQVQASIKQGRREISPRIDLGKGDDPRVSLTLVEALTLGELLIRLVDEATVTRPA